MSAAAGLLLAAWAAGWRGLALAWSAQGGGVLPALTRTTAAALADHLEAAAAAGAVLVACWGSGRALRRRSGPPAQGALEAGVLDLGLGAALWGTLFFLLGLAGLLARGPLAALVGAAVVFAAAGAWARRPDLTRARAELSEAGWTWTASLGVHLAVLAPYAFVPETFFDALEYHLGLPRLYLLRGGVTPVPDNAFSGVPNLPSMLYGWTLALEPEGRAAHALGFAFLPAAGLALMGLGRRLGAPRAGGLAAALFALSPCVTSSAQMTGVEGAWAFFGLASLCAVLSAVATPGRGAPWAAAGLLIGAGMACKTLAWGLPAAALAAAWAAGGRPPARAALWAATAAAAALAPWLLRNAVHYGNPLYPFFHERLVPGAEVMPGWRYLGSGAVIPWGDGLGAGLKAWLTAPLAALAYQARHADSAGAVLLGLLPAGLWAARTLPAWRPLLLFAGALWLPLSLATPLPRYHIAALAPLSLAAALAVERTGAARALRPLTAAALAASAALCWRWALPLSRLAVFTGEKPAGEFLARSDRAYYPTPLYAAARWLAGNSPRGARVLVFGDARGFHVPRDHVLSTPMQTTVLERWANAAADGDALRARFAAEGITHVLVNHGDIVRQRLELRFSPRGKAALDDFWARWTRRAFAAGPDFLPDRSLDRWVVVYEVRAEPGRGGDDLFAGYSVTAGPR